MLRRFIAGTSALAVLAFFSSVGCDKLGVGADPAPTANTGQPASTGRVMTFTPPGATGTQKAGTPTPTTAAPPTPKTPCVACPTQEAFDDAQRKKQTCCAQTACVADNGCSGGRVCCRVPGGTLCTDSGRCAAGDRVKSAPKVQHGACRTANDCPEGLLCCDTGAGPGKPGQCMGISDGIKGCAPPP